MNWPINQELKTLLHNHNQQQHHHHHWSWSHDHDHNYLVTICHYAMVGFWKKTSADYFHIVGFQLRGPPLWERFWIYYDIFERFGFANRVFEFNPISTAASLHPIYSSEQAANRAFDYPVMVPQLKASKAQKFGLTFFDALPPMILFHLLLVVKALFAWSCIQVCGTLGGYPGGDALRCLFDSFRQLLDFLHVNVMPLCEGWTMWLEMCSVLRYVWEFDCAPIKYKELWSWFEWCMWEDLGSKSYIPWMSFWKLC